MTGPAVGGHFSEIRAAQVSTVYRQMPIALAVNAANAAITAFVLHRLTQGALPFVWLCIVGVVTAARGGLWIRYRRVPSSIGRGAFWWVAATCGALAAGLCWGVGGVVLFPTLPSNGQMFLALVIAGMCAGAVVTSAPHLPTLIAFLFAASLPMAILFFWQSSLIANALGAMTMVFAAALALAGRHLNQIFAQTLRLQFELSRTNVRLQSEIAERQATEAVLRQAQKLEAIGQLTGGIAHDFNNLLTIVIGNLMLAIGRAGENSTIEPLLDAALQAAERGVALIQRLLAFARKQHLDPRSVDLSTLVTGTEVLLRRTLGSRIRLQISKDADLAPARVDANQLELAILNLTINARDAMPRGGVLHIELQNRRADQGAVPDLSPGEYLVISIADTGIGMDEATLARAFEPFFTTKQIGSGSGLGLPMVQGFAAQSGGAVQIHSKPGEGTTVELWLPQAKEPPSEPDRTRHSPFPMR